MISDLVFGVLVIVILSAALFACGTKISRRGRTRLATVFGTATVAAVVSFGLWGHGRLWLARVLPFSNVMVLGNWMPLGAAFLAGLAWGHPKIPWWRRSLISAVILALSLYALLHPLVRPRAAARDLWTADGVCMQTSDASCSAAAAATILRHYDIPASEKELVQLCLTDRHATAQLGLYRGLKLKTAGTPWRVQVIHSDVDGLRQADAWPVVLLVRLESSAGVDPRYEQQWGWTPGLGHAVVVFGIGDDDLVDVGDPSIGREYWTLDDLRVLWHGDGFRLVRK